MIDPSEDYKIKFCLDFFFFFFFGKINSKKFKQVKLQEENNGISKKKQKKRFVPAPKERSKHAQHFFRS